MTKTLSRLMVTAAAAGMAAAPIAAQTDTRASSAPVYAQQASAQPGTARDDDDGEGIAALGIPAAVAALFGTAAAAGVIVVVTDDDGDGDDDDDVDNGFDQSPGT